jgi:uncharacterized protein YjbI with pentapeptide repeats
LARTGSSWFPRRPLDEDSPPTHWWTAPGVAAGRLEATMARRAGMPSVHASMQQRTRPRWALKLKRHKKRRWREQDPPWWVQDILIAFLLGVILLVGQSWLDDARSERELRAATTTADEADRRENLRFVRERSTTQAAERPFHSMDLADQNLSGLLMAGADLASANLASARLEGADLSNAILVEADLGRANLTNATLMNANLTNANLTDARFAGVNLAGADLSYATGLSDTYLSGFGAQEKLNMTGVKLRWVSLDRSNFAFMDLTNADLTNATLFHAFLVGTNFRGATLTNVFLGGADITGADFREADLSGAHIDSVKYIGGFCYNSATVWPAGFSPPPSRCRN